MEIFIYIFAFSIGIAIAIGQRYVMRNIKIQSNKKKTAAHKNIGVIDRIVRFVIATGVLVYGIYAGSEIAFVIAGYTYYEALAKWCGFYALIGKNSCPL